LPDATIAEVVLAAPLHLPRKAKSNPQPLLLRHSISPLLTSAAMEKEALQFQTIIKELP
jgi:hypothetical protein